MEPTQIRVGGGRRGLEKLDKRGRIHQHGRCQTPRFVLAFAYGQTSHSHYFSALEDSGGRVPILGSDHASSGLPTHQDIKPCEPPSDAPRLPAA